MMPITDDPLPWGVLTDSYKVTHSTLYPADLQYATAYGEFRWSFDQDPHDHRILFWGLDNIINRYLAHRWTHYDVEQSLTFYRSHFPPGTNLDHLASLFQSIIDEHDGWFPIRIWGLPEGTICYPHIPVYIMEAEGRFAPLITWWETILTHLWYPTTVATLSRRCRDIIEEALEQCGCPINEDSTLVESRLHDFGFRGCTTVEQAMIGGAAHLLSFSGSDTAVAAYYVQQQLNQGSPIAQSIPATEHSIMLAHFDERQAILRAIEKYGEGVFAVVLDTFDFEGALERLLPCIKSEKVGAGGFLVIRPDSGDPVVAVLSALRALHQIFGSDINRRGYRVLKGCGVIQGDGMTISVIKNILKAVISEGFSVENVAFGMGAGLLHRAVHRDTMGFATKLSQVQNLKESTTRDVCKFPQGNAQKASLPGRLRVYRQGRDPPGFLKVRTAEEEPDLQEVDAMILYYDHGPVERARSSFTELKAQSLIEWRHAPLQYDPISDSLKSKQQRHQNNRHL